VNDLNSICPVQFASERCAEETELRHVDGSGKIFLNMKEVDLIALQQLLVQLREQDPDLSVLRATVRFNIRKSSTP